MDEYIVVKKIFQESDKNIYRGSRDDCEFVKTILEEYHKFDRDVSISIIGVYTEFNTIRSFMNEYQYEYDELKKKGKL